MASVEVHHGREGEALITYLGDESSGPYGSGGAEIHAVVDGEIGRAERGIVNLAVVVAPCAVGDALVVGHEACIVNAGDGVEGIALLESHGAEF